MKTVLIIIAILASAMLAADEMPPAVNREVDFARDVRPIFEKRCFSCHSGEKQEAGLRLDRSELAMLGGDSGKAIVIGNSGESRLIHYVAATESEKVMPPEGAKLSKDEIGVLRAWVDRGAVWADSKSADSANSKHWAYQPLKATTPPEVIDANWVVNPVDRFILSKLEGRGRAPSPEADRFALIRRLNLDLVGLLPSLVEVEAFVSDTSPKAYEKIVDRLLDSPHFGERWGRHWLDMARYADSDGYEKDNPRPDAYRWRDWVIDAINSDMPFDQFTIEQLAGDLLPEATPMQRLATAFHRQTLTNTEGGTDQEQFRVEACFDRTETTGAVWLGLTVGCARCHSHKYDAISQREYYQLFAFYNNGDEQTLVVPKSEEEIGKYEQAKASHDAAVAEATSELRVAQRGIVPALSIWEEDIKLQMAKANENPIKRELLLAPSVSSDGDVTFKQQTDGSWLASGANPEVATYTLQGKTAGNAFDTIRLDVLADKSLPAKGPGRVAKGNFVLSEITVETSETADFVSPRRLEFDTAKADHEQGDRPWLAKNAIDSDDKTGWAIGSLFGLDHWAEFHLKETITATTPIYLRIKLSHQYGKQHTIGRFKVSLQSGLYAPVELPKNILKILALPSAGRDDSQRQELLDHFSSIEPSTKSFAEKLTALTKKEPAKPELTVRVITQRAKETRKTFVLRRGEFLEPVPDVDVQPSGLGTLPALSPRKPEQQGDRLDLARWLVSNENPITPRVTVNHIWRTLFGIGIVKTANDFGVRGEAPTHPELLDWLSRDFIGLNRSDEIANSKSKPWSRKALIKQIVMSATYRQSSKRRIDLLEIDPQNQLLASQNRLRVEGEIVRDICLDAAGLLARKIGGPSVFPALPPGIAELSYAGNFKWTVSNDTDRYRRGMYTFFKRTAPHPNLITFDCPDANLTCVDRNKSNTPLQALVSLNNESFAEAAQALARRILVSSENVDAKIRLETAFRLCVARPPSERDLNELFDLLEVSRRWYAGHLEEAKALIGKFAVPNISVEENAAWIATARVLINLDEFITRE